MNEEVRHYLEVELTRAIERLNRNSPFYDGVLVGYKKASTLNKRHALFCERLLRMLDEEVSE